MTQDDQPAPEREDPLRHALVHRAYTEIYLPRRAPVVFPEMQKEKLYDLAAEAMGQTLGTYLEFGVYEGWSMSRMVRRFTHPDSRFVGFDSFEGLPEQWGSMNVGHFSTRKKLPSIPDPRVHFVPGWFQNTVSEFLQGSAPLRPPVLVNFDADLYTSTLFLLTSLWHFVPEYHFFFDEFMPDEIVAMYDFTSAYPVEFEFVAATEDQHRRPEQVYGRIKNTRLQL